MKIGQLTPKTIKLDPKIVKNRAQEASWRGLGGSWGPLGGVLAGSWAQEGSKIEKISKIERLVSPVGGQFGLQNRSKIDLGAIKKIIYFGIVFGIDF